MWKHAWLVLGCAWSMGAWSAPGLTDTENRWLELGAPVLAHAREQNLPLDIIVQPQPTLGLAPLAMAFVDGRCKLVLSMRGNPEAEATLRDIEPALLAPVIEAMTAHEIGHCWRYVRGAWHTVPAGFVDHRADDLRSEALAEAQKHMQESRREEGFADLVGLAWTRRMHPQQYTAVHAWFETFRADPAHPGSEHDTLAWVNLAASREAFGDGSASLFEQAWPLWKCGLLTED